MKVVFMGTPEFAVATLESIIKAGHEVAAVFTQPDKPKGRGKAMQFTPVKEKAVEHGIPVYQPIKIREQEWVDMLIQMAPDVIVVVAFGQLMPKVILDIPKYGCVNVHSSLLPKYRGAAPIQWAVIDGEEESGVTTMLMDEGLDTGDILMKATTKLSEEETGGSLHDRLAEMGANLLVETLHGLEEGTVTRTKQGPTTTRYAERLTKSLGNIDFAKPAKEIERLIRGLNPWPSAYTSFEGKTLKVWKASVLYGSQKGKPGQVVFVDKSSIHVQTGDGLLALEEIQLEGKKRMMTDAFLRGNQVEEGIILGQ